MVACLVRDQEAAGSSPATPTTSEWTLLHSDFSLHKNQSYAPSFLLYRKKARSARLFACKRSQRLTAATTFLRVAPAAQIPRQGGVGFFNWKGLEPQEGKKLKSCKPHYLGLAAFLYTIFGIRRFPSVMIPAFVSSQTMSLMLST